MRTLKKTSFISLAVFLVWAFSSCGTSNFQGYYPENRITGKGIGRAQTPAPANTLDIEENTATVEVAASNVTVEPVVEVQEEKTAEEILLENRFIRRNMPEIASLTSVTQANELNERIKNMPWHQKLGAKMFSRTYQKQLKKNSQAANMSTADIFSIVSISAGGLALISWIYGAFVFGVGAIVMGALALKKGTSRRGMAIAGIALGALALVMWPVIYFIAIRTVVI